MSDPKQFYQDYLRAMWHDATEVPEYGNTLWLIMTDHSQPEDERAPYYAAGYYNHITHEFILMAKPHEAYANYTVDQWAEVCTLTPHN